MASATTAAAPVEPPAAAAASAASVEAKAKEVASRYATPAVPTHRHAAAELRALAGVRKLFTETQADGWTVVSNEKGVEIAGKPSPGSAMGLIRGMATVAGLTAIELYATSQLPGCRIHWDPLFETGRAVEMLGPRSLLSYAASKGVWPTSGRDFSVVLGTDTQADGCIVSAAASVVDPAVPEVSGKVRAEMKLNGWYFEPLNEGKDTRVMYVTDIDLKGNVPSSLVKTVANRMPMCVHSVRKFATEHGAPPYPLVIGGLLRGTPDFDHPSSTLKAQLAVDTGIGNETHFFIGRRRYKDGFSVTVSPSEGVTASMVANGSASGKDSVFALHHLGANGRTLNITIVPSVGILFNGAPLPGTAKAEESAGSASPASASAAPPSAAPRAYATHRHSQAIDNALLRLREWAADDQWTQVAVKSDVTISQRTGVVQPLSVVRGVGIIRGYTPLEIYTTDSSARLVWDSLSEKAEVVEVFDHATVLTYVASKAQWPTSGRDFACCLRTHRDDDGTLWSVAVSVDDAKIPEVSGKVRARIRLNGWRLRPLPDGSGTEATYISDLDLAGSIPGAILSTVSTKLPMCVAAVRDYLVANGPPPAFVSLQGDSRFGLRFDHASSTLGGAFLVRRDNAPATVIHVSRARFPKGVAVSFVPAGKITAKRTPEGDVILDIPPELEGVSVTMKLGPAAGGSSFETLLVDGRDVASAAGAAGARAGGPSLEQEDAEIRRLVQVLADRLEQLEKKPSAADAGQEGQRWGTAFLLAGTVVAFALSRIF